MKQLIKDILKEASAGQVNLESSSAREMIANLIMAGIKSGKGWFLDLGTRDKNDACSHGNDLLSNCHECDEQQAKDSWVCGICNKSTYDVEYDYMGS